MEAKTTNCHKYPWLNAFTPFLLAPQKKKNTGILGSSEYNYFFKRTTAYDFGSKKDKYNGTNAQKKMKKIN